jgi:hypothetical protein
MIGVWVGIYEFTKISGCPNVKNIIPLNREKALFDFIIFVCYMYYKGTGI